MKQLYVLFCMALLLQVGVFAQDNEQALFVAKAAGPHSGREAKQQTDEIDIRISGQVTNEDGEPFIGATIIVKGTSTGTVTDVDGNYSLTVPDENSILVFSAVGYGTQEQTVGGRTVINVTLLTDISDLEEVVVTALGVKKEAKKLGYSVTAVNTDELLENRTTNVMESLEGRVAGLNITPPAAGAGSSMQIRLRGQIAFAGANNAPLIVINGLPIDQGARSANRGDGGPTQTRDLGDNLSNINPDDIESMTVLKGATAAAIYGSRAANGAIIITTKSGTRNQGIGVEYTSNYSTQHALDFFDFQTEYGQGVGGARPSDAANAATTGQFAWGERLDGRPTPIFDGSMQPYSANPNRLFDFLQTGTNWTNTVAFSGGGAKGSFRASISNTDAKGITPTNEYKRNIVNLGVNQNITDRLSLQFNVNYTNEHQINPPQIGIQGPGAVNFLTRMATSIPLSAFENSAVAANGTETLTSGFQTTLLNPYYRIAVGQFFKNERDRFLATATLRYDLTDWLYVQGRYNYDYSINFTEFNNPGGIGTSLPTNADGTFKGTYNVGEDKGTDVNADFLIGGNQQFGKFSVDASFGGNTWQVKNHGFSQNASNFIVRDLYSIGNGSVQNQNFGFSQYEVNSLYGWAEFGFNSMLYLNFTGRNDWFSVLNPADNSEFYQSISGSFIFSELMTGQDWLTYGKLRASWAEVGSSQGVNPYDGVLTYGIAQNQFNNQSTASINGNVAPNQFLTPFTVEEKEFGLEMRMFNNRLAFDVSYFDKVSKDQVLGVVLSNTSGYDQSKQNLGSLKNSGLEWLIELTPIQTPNFSWTTSWNNALLNTEVLSVGEPDELIVVNWGTSGLEFIGQLRYVEGMPMNQIYARTYKRDAQGNILLTDQGRLIPSDDYVSYGSSIPKHTGGWGNTFRYKALSVGVHFDYKLGGYVISSTALNANRQGHSKQSLVGRRQGESGVVWPGVYASSGEPNTTAVDPAQFYADFRNNQMGDIVTFKSDFVKLRNISLSYDLSNILPRSGSLSFLKGLSLTASCRNVALLYKDIPDLDPEAIQSSGDFRAGYENTSLPTTRNFNFSLNARF
jgi:TonB-linked SusC/RagA family outer membrane protein